LVRLTPQLIGALVVAVPVLEVLVGIINHAELSGIVDEEAARG
jgi:hypothetical protein